MRSKVDPAALFLAVVAVAAAALTGAGDWSLVTTITSGVVIIVVGCFTFPTKPRPGEDLPGKPAILAQCVIYGFISVIGTAWLFQESYPTGDFYTYNYCPIRTPSTYEDVQLYLICRDNYFDGIAEDATKQAMLAGAAVAGLAALVLVLRVRWLARFVDAVESSAGDEPEPEGQGVHDRGEVALPKDDAALFSLWLGPQCRNQGRGTPDRSRRFGLSLRLEVRPEERSDQSA